MDLTIIFDALIAVLLVTTIGYAVVLNKKLGVLRNAKSEMEALIGQFSESADRARNGIQSLKQEAQRSGTAMQNKIEMARGLVDDLGFLIEHGSGLAEQLDDGVGAARAKAGAIVGRPRAPAARTPSPPAAPPAAAAETETEPPRKTTPPDVTADVTADAMGDAEGDAGPAEAAAPDLSAAESELLKALQGMR
jgi:hypothetical protein